MGGYEVDEEAIPNWMKKTTITRHTAGSKSVLNCDGCGHEWVNRVEQPQKCPGCGAKIKWGEESTETNESPESEEPGDIEDLFGDD